MQLSPANATSVPSSLSLTLPNPMTGFALTRRTRAPTAQRVAVAAAPHPDPADIQVGEHASNEQMEQCKTPLAARGMVFWHTSQLQPEYVAGIPLTTTKACPAGQCVAAVVDAVAVNNTRNHTRYSERWKIKKTAITRNQQYEILTTTLTRKQRCNGTIRLKLYLRWQQQGQPHHMHCTVNDQCHSPVYTEDTPNNPRVGALKLKRWQGGAPARDAVCCRHRMRQQTVGSRPYTHRMTSAEMRVLAAQDELLRRRMRLMRRKQMGRLEGLVAVVHHE